MSDTTAHKPPYDKMYYAVCDKTSRALDVLPDIPINRATRELLQSGLDEAEEMYINAAPPADLDLQE